MTGRITKLIDHQQSGAIAGDDGEDYMFASQALRDVNFSSLSVGVAVTFEPFTGARDSRRANAIRLAAKHTR
jgi:hypothetical protein